MTVLFHELLVPGWADTKIGVYELTRNENSGYKEDEGFGLPCHSVDPELFFSESQEMLETAKDLCTACPMRARCLEGALATGAVGCLGRRNLRQWSYRASEEATRSTT